jgi:hypothetical protein
VRIESAILRSAGAYNKQDQRQKRKSNLDVLAVDLLGKDEKLCDLGFHKTPLSIGICSNDTPGQASKVASKQAGIINK